MGMQGDILSGIRAKYNQLTKAEKRVADVILRDPRAVLFMSITDLAEMCGVGDTSVFRFCKTMNLKGYQEFKMRMSLSFHDGKPVSSYLENDIVEGDTFTQVSQKVLNTNVSALTETHSLLDEEWFLQVVDKMERAGRICFFGAGTSMLTAMKAANKFLMIEPGIVCVQDTHIQTMIAATMKPGEVAMVFSYSGATKDSIHIAKLAKDAGAFIVCVTRFVKSPLTAYGDITLLCGANEGPLQRGSTSAEVSQLFLIDLLYTEYYRRRYEACQRVHEITSDSVLDKQY